LAFETRFRPVVVSFGFRGIEAKFLAVACIGVARRAFLSDSRKSKSEARNGKGSRRGGQRVRRAPERAALFYRRSRRRRRRGLVKHFVNHATLARGIHM
jgi:hypothetical protein